MSTTRREQLLDTAARLFAARGFHGVSMHEIGTACGVTGPAIYRHFSGKDAMLAQMLIEISQRLVTEADRRSRASADARSRLRALVEWHIEFALEHPALIVVQEREWTNLQHQARDAVRLLQLAYIDRWVEVVRELCPDLERASSRARVQAVFGMLNSTPHSARIGESRMRELLTPMAEAALLAQPAPGARSG